MFNPGPGLFNQNVNSYLVCFFSNEEKTATQDKNTNFALTFSKKKSTSNFAKKIKHDSDRFHVVSMDTGQ